MVKRKKDSFITRRSFLGYDLGGIVYFAVAWTIITFGAPHIGLWWANIIGNLTGITLNYFVQRFMAFPGRHIFNSGLRYVVYTAVNLVLSYLLLRLLTNYGIKLWFAQFISAGIFTVWNYAWYKLWVFKDD